MSKYTGEYQVIVEGRFHSKIYDGDNLPAAIRTFNHLTKQSRTAGTHYEGCEVYLKEGEYIVLDAHVPELNS